MERFEARSKKKYELSLKRSERTRANDNGADPAMLEAPRVHDEYSDPTDSQKIELRVSDSYQARDSDERDVVKNRYDEEEVILISDSSDDESSERREPTRPKTFEFGRRSSMYTSDDTFDKENSSRSRPIASSKDKLAADSDESMFSRATKRGVSTDGRANVESASSRRLPERAKDGATNENESPYDLPEVQRRIVSADKSKNGRIEASERTPLSVKSRNASGSSNNTREETPRIPKCATITRARTGSRDDTPRSLRISEEAASSRKNRETAGKTEEALPSAKKSSSRTILSRKDVRNILKVVESKRVVYRPPEDRERAGDSSDADDATPSIFSKGSSTNARPRMHPAIIAETDSDSEDDIIRGSRVDISRPYETHVTRFLESATNRETTDVMSQKKRLEIAHWLMSNSPAGTADSSISNVSASNGHGLSSGDSSLERLEMNHETPNNRDRMRRLHTDEKRKYDRSNSAKSRQTFIDDFVKRSEDGTRKILTPIAVGRKKVSPEREGKSENLEIEDCVDILDNLYGESWRSRANDVLPSTEPRRKNIQLRDKGVQTERKAKPRSGRATGTSESGSKDDDEFDKFVRNIGPNLNSTKKPPRMPERDRFIKDSSSSESSGETTYLTALTNPRISNERKINNRHTPLAPHVRRAIAICDSETDEDDDKLFDNRKVLSFSEDDSDSDASEYDPNDVIPVKTTMKTTTPKNVPKTARIPISAINTRIAKPTSTFLASLSASVAPSEAHRDSMKYRRDFKNTREELCKYLYGLYNEKIFDGKLPSDMSIEWNVRMRGTAGFCYNKRSVKALGGVARSSRIVLATKILDTPDRLRDTLVHEMCHAAAWLINDVSDGHGPFWKAWAAKAMRAFPELPAIKRCHDYKVTTKFTYRCIGCGYSIGRHSKSLNVERKRCGHCYGKFELLINRVTKSGRVEACTPVIKKPSAFALFVKENYSTVKKKRGGVPHKEVMQILGQQFSAIKITRTNKRSDENNSASGD